MQCHLLPVNSELKVMCGCRSRCSKVRELIMYRHRKVTVSVIHWRFTLQVQFQGRVTFDMGLVYVQGKLKGLRQVSKSYLHSHNSPSMICLHQLSSMPITWWDLVETFVRNHNILELLLSLGYSMYLFSISPEID